MFKKISKYLEAVGFYLIVFIFQHLSVKKASAFGGWLARSCGPMFPISKTAYKNLSFIFPRLHPEEKNTIIQSMWNNWGEIAAEYCHLPTFVKDSSFYTVEGIEIIQALEADNKPAILFTAHLSNFQFISIAASAHGLPLVQFYRGANNKFVDKKMLFFQNQVSKKVISKKQAGLKTLVQSLQKNEHVLMIIDQKFSQGILIPFLGKPAWTSSSVATLAKRFNCPLVPVRVERKKRLHYHITFYPPLDCNKDAKDIMIEVNDIMGKWIKARPEQWFWVHKRWPFSE